MKKDTAIAFTTGRKCVKDVASMLAKNIENNGHLDSYNFHLIVSYDPTFYGLKPKDFKIPEDTHSTFSTITYLGTESYKNLSWLKNTPEVDDKTFEILFKARGEGLQSYSAQKNRATLTALMQGVERVLFLDDDEYFIAPFKNGKGLEWVEQDVVGVHLQHNPNADITNGAHTGYFSPIPSDLEICLEESLRQRLGEILSVGSEIINEQTFLNTKQSVRYGDDNFLESTPFEIPENKGVKGLNGGNITLNLKSVREGKIPPYFHPPGARGEDAILGMQIPDLSVLKVGAYTFHDPFQKYVEITKGDYPQEIEAIKVIPGTIDRFCKACTGWVRYAPFLIRLTSQNEEEYKNRIKAMEQPLEEVGTEIDKQLGWDGFKDMKKILCEYDTQSENHINELEQTKNAWTQIVQAV